MSSQRQKLALRNSAIVSAMVSVLCGCLATHANATNLENQKINNKTEKVKLKKIIRKYEKMKVGEKNIASAMSIISNKEIKNSSTSESIYSILKMTPSVNEYQQNIGPGTPTLTVRGVRMSQIAQTLDGIPMISLLYGGQGAVTTNNIGSLVSTGQLSGIHVYPGVAPPNRAGFATVGGTISYATKKPTNTFYTKLFSKIGSFSTENYGLQINSGNIPHTDGLKILARLSQTKTAGYIQHTPARYTDLLFSADKPYDEGLSSLTATIIYNQGRGNLLLYPPVPTNLIKLNGYTYNYPLSTASNEEDNKYLTAILGDQTYVNNHLIIGGKLFYISKSYLTSSFGNPKYINLTYPYQLNGQSPFFLQGPISSANGNAFNFSYNPAQVFGTYEAGEAAEITKSTSRTFGITPTVTIFLQHNVISMGALITEEESGDTNGSYIYGSLTMPETLGYNAIDFGNTARRIVYSGFLQDKMSLFNDSLHIQPGVTITGVHSSNYVPFNNFNSPSHPYTLSNYDKVILPYLGLSYDLNKNYIIYASYGKGARFAPVNDYVLGASGSTTLAPGPETVNSYEAGIRYVSNRLYLNFDGFWQNMHGMFSFNRNDITNVSSYANIGDEQMKGFELSGKYQLNRNINLFGNTSFTQANYLNAFKASDTPFQGQYGYVFAGDPLAAVPNWLATLGISYHKNNFETQLNGSYTGPQPITYNIENLQSPLGLLPDPTVPDASEYLPGYFLVNLSAHYKILIHKYHINSVSLSLNVDNLLNNQYYVHLYHIYKEFGFYPVGQQQSYALIGEPRFIEVGISGKFT